MTGAEMGWLHLDQAIGLTAHRFGFAVMVGALAWGGFLLWRGRSPLKTA